MNPGKERLSEKDIKTYLNEVSEIEIRTFVIEDVIAFDAQSLDKKLKDLKKLYKEKEKEESPKGKEKEELPKGKEEFSKTYFPIGLGDAFQKSMNAMYSGKANVALIVERRVVTLLEK